MTPEQLAELREIGLRCTELYGPKPEKPHGEQRRKMNRHERRLLKEAMKANVKLEGFEE